MVDVKLKMSHVTCLVTEKEQRHSMPCSILHTELRVPRYYRSGPGSSVGIATDYRLDDPGSNPGWDEIFRPSRSALGSTQPPVKWVPVLSRG